MGPRHGRRRERKGRKSKPVTASFPGPPSTGSKWLNCRATCSMCSTVHCTFFEYTLAHKNFVQSLAQGSQCAPQGTQVLCTYPGRPTPCLSRPHRPTQSIIDLLGLRGCEVPSRIFAQSLRLSPTACYVATFKYGVHGTVVSFLPSRAACPPTHAAVSRHSISLITTDGVLAQHNSQPTSACH